MICSFFLFDGGEKGEAEAEAEAEAGKSNVLRTSFRFGCRNDISP